MQRHEIEARVLDVLRAALKCAVEQGTQRADVAAWDSLRHIELAFAIEDELGLQFDEDELAALDSVAAIVDAAMRHSCATAL